MNTCELKRSDVTFNPGPHTYTTKDGRPLSGVTSLLRRHMFAHKYDDIPGFVLKKAAERGTSVHSRIQLCDSLGVIPADDPEIQAYNVFKEKYGVKAIANEYLVTDGVNVASCIDVVYDDLSLCDIKTTSRLDMDYLSWQLSIYAYLFEFQNPGLKVPRLLAMWLPKERYGSPNMVEVPRIPASECARLIECDAAGLEYTPPSSSEVALMDANRISVHSDVIDAVVDFETRIKAMTEQRDELKKGLLDLMRKNDVKNWTSDDGRLTLTLRKGGNRTSVDASLLKADYPLVYEKCVKTMNFGDSLTIKINHNQPDKKQTI